MDITGRRPEDSGSLSHQMPATDLRSAGSTTSATRLSHHIPVSRQLASKLLAVASQSLAILPDWARRSQPTRLSVPTSTYHLVACLVGTGSAVLVDQTTDGLIRFVTTPATGPRRYGDQPFFVAMAQEWRNGPRWLSEHMMIMMMIMILRPSTLTLRATWSISGSICAAIVLALNMKTIIHFLSLWQ